MDWKVKNEQNHQFIQTVWGRGYQFVEDKKNITEDKGKRNAIDSLSQVLGPFYRKDQARQRQTGGTGLELYLVKLIVDAHKGTNYL